MSLTPRLLLEFFDSVTRSWTTASQIFILDHLPNRWSAFGAGERIVNELEDGLYPEFCNIIRYPSMRISLTEIRALPFSVFFRIPRLETVFMVPNLIFGAMREIPNFLGELKAKSWGFVYLDGPWIPSVLPPPPGPEFAGVILYENLTVNPITENVVVRFHAYIPGSLNVLRNGLQELRKDAGVVGDTWEELNPAAGSFRYYGPWHSDDILTVQYAYPKTV